MTLNELIKKELNEISPAMKAGFFDKGISITDIKKQIICEYVKKNISNKFANTTVLCHGGIESGFIDVHVFNVSQKEWELIKNSINKLDDEVSNYSFYLMPFLTNKKDTKQFYRKYYKPSYKKP